MKSRECVLTVFAVLVAAPGTLVAQKPAPDPAKVGILNMNVAVSETAEGKKSLQEIQAKYQTRGQQLQQEQQEIQNIQDQLQRQAATLSDDERLRLNRQLDEKQKIFKRAQEDYQSDLQEDEQDAVRRIAQKMDHIVKDFAEKNGFAVVLEGPPQMPIYYMAPQVDLTDEIVKRYDAAYPLEPAAGGATATPPPKKAVTPTKAPATKAPATKPKP
jgi:outer membrane protein